MINYENNNMVMLNSNGLEAIMNKIKLIVDEYCEKYNFGVEYMYNEQTNYWHITIIMPNEFPYIMPGESPLAVMEIININMRDEQIECIYGEDMMIIKLNNPNIHQYLLAYLNGEDIIYYDQRIPYNEYLDITNI